MLYSMGIVISVSIVVNVRLFMMVIVILVKNVLKSNGVIFKMVVIVVREIGCKWLSVVFIIVLWIFCFFLIWRLIFLMSIMVFLINMLNRFKKLSNDIKLNGIFVVSNFVIIFIMVMGIIS